MTREPRRTALLTIYELRFAEGLRLLTLGLVASVAGALALLALALRRAGWRTRRSSYLSRFS